MSGERNKSLERHRYRHSTSDHANCSVLSCKWATSGEYSYQRARKHTRETGHRTQCYSSEMVIYTRREVRDPDDMPERQADIDDDD